MYTPPPTPPSPSRDESRTPSYDPPSPYSYPDSPSPYMSPPPLSPPSPYSSWDSPPPPLSPPSPYSPPRFPPYPDSPPRSPAPPDSPPRSPPYPDSPPRSPPYPDSPYDPTPYPDWDPGASPSPDRGPRTPGYDTPSPSLAPSPTLTPSPSATPPRKQPRWGPPVPAYQVVIHIAGASGSGKSTLAGRIRETFGDSVAVKDTDEFIQRGDDEANRLAPFEQGDPKRYMAELASLKTRKIDEFLAENHTKRVVVLVGLMDHFGLKKPFYDVVRAAFKYYIDIKPADLLRQFYSRLVQEGTTAGWEGIARGDDYVWSSKEIVAEDLTQWKKHERYGYERVTSDDIMGLVAGALPQGTVELPPGSPEFTFPTESRTPLTPVDGDYVAPACKHAFCPRPEVEAHYHCSGCRRCHYCSPHCQRADWPRHQRHCARLARQTAAAAAE